MIWKLPARAVSFPGPTRIMGIVNLNDDSFSGDGTLDPDAAAALARAAIEAGADIVDIGAESARTNRPAITVAEEIRRFRAFLERWPEIVAASRPRDDGQLWPPVLSANSWRPEVAEAILPGGVELLNDMGALPDARNAEICARHGVSLLIMHSVGAPKVPHRDQSWPDVMTAIRGFFREKIALAESAGLEREALVLDPGIDFAKQTADNLAIYRHLADLHEFDRPLLAPISRKTVIDDILARPDPTERDAGTIACAAAAIRRGAQILRVHNVAAAWQTARVLDTLSANQE